MAMVYRPILASIFLAVACPAVGQSTGETAGQVTAFVCEALPSPLKVDVEVSDEPLQADRLRRILVRSLVDHQAVVTPDAPLQLSLYVNFVHKAETLDPKTRFHVTLWSNRRDSLFGSQHDERHTAEVSELHVEIMLDNLTDGHCIWQGKAVHRLDGRDEQVMAEKMIPMLIKRLGRSVRAEPIELD